MPWWQTAMLVAMVLAMDVVIVGAVISVAGAAIRDLAARFPPREPLGAGVRRNYQSFAFGLSNFGGCIHVAVDEDHLHLIPARFARWFGARAMSIPWGAIEPGKRRGRTMHAKITGTDVKGPAWCLELARPPGEPGPDAQQPPS